jgi:GTP cyclohydrolase I
MGASDALTTQERLLHAARLTSSLRTSTRSTRKRQRRRKDKQRTRDAPAAFAPLTDSRAVAFEQRHSGHGPAARDPRDELAVQKTRRPPGRRSPSPVIDGEGLSRPSKGTRSRIDEGPEQAEDRLTRMCGAVRTLLECVGEDPNREGLLATPLRYAKALLSLTQGYQVDVEATVNHALFHEGHHEMIIVKNIEIHSLCEHHLVPFTGKVCLARTPSPRSPTRRSPRIRRCTSATSPLTR